MRLLREVDDETTARLMRDALYHRGIHSNVSHSQSGTYLVWVIDEKHLDRASQLSRCWLDDGQAQDLRAAAERGRREKGELVRDAELRREQIEAAKAELSRALRPKPTPLSWGLLAMCLAVFVLSGAPGLGAMDTQLERVVGALGMVSPDAYAEVSQHALWGVRIAVRSLPLDAPHRLITPIFVHFGVLHLLFSVVLLSQLARVIEMRHGTLTLFLLGSVAAVVTNVAQFQVDATTPFGGMSAVIYALLGFLWIRGRIDATAGYRLAKGAVLLMLGLLSLGFVADIGFLHVTRYGQLLGLLVGMAWAVASAPSEGEGQKAPMR